MAGTADGGVHVQDREVTYRRVFPGGSWLQQIQLGSVIGEGAQARAMRGVTVSNAPFVRGLRFDDVAFSRPLPPGWEYEVYEGAREDNNFTTSNNQVSISVPQLQLGVAQDLTLDTGEIRVFRVTVPEGETLRVRLTSSAASAANEIYLRHDDVPTGYQFDAAYSDPLQPNQTAVVASTKPGEYYIMVRGHQEPADNTPALCVLRARASPAGPTSRPPS